MKEKIKLMSVDDLSDYLSLEVGLPLQYCDVLEGTLCVVCVAHIHIAKNYVDGKVLLSLTKSDQLEMITPIGLVKIIVSLTEDKAVHQV